MFNGDPRLESMEDETKETMEEELSEAAQEELVAKLRNNIECVGWTHQSSKFHQTTVDFLDGYGTHITVPPHMFIGKRVAVKWTKKDKPIWYKGTITKFIPWSKRHGVTYDDGTRKPYDLTKRKLRWMDKELRTGFGKTNVFGIKENNILCIFAFNSL